MFELVAIELLFDRWLKADVQIHRQLDESEKRRNFELFREAFFWAWAIDVVGFQKWLIQKTGCRWIYSDMRLVPGEGLVPRDPLGR